MGKVLTFARAVTDSLQNLVSGLGTTKDKATATEYGLPLWTDQDLLLAYRGSWLSRKIVDIPAFDALRKWRAWQAEESIVELIEAEETRLGLRNKLLSAKIKARLFGGSALLIGKVGEDPQNYRNPLEPTSIGKQQLFATVLLRRQLNAGDLDMFPESEYYGCPSYYELNVAAGATGVAMPQGLRIHPSRLVIFHGLDSIDPELSPSANGRGWGDSVLSAAITTIRQTDSTAANIASMVFEGKIDVIRVPDLMANMADPEYRSRLLERFQLANVAKSINNGLLLDKEEEFAQKQLSFGGLPDVLSAFMQLVSGAADIPMTRLLGQSPAGMNATGESDLRNYYDRIQAIQEIELRPAISRLDECVIRSATGQRPAELHYIWNSLWQISDKERADIGKVIVDSIVALNNTALYPPEALANASMNALVEHSMFPGLIEEVEAAGGLPDYEAQLEAEREAEIAAAAARRPANNNERPRAAVGDSRFEDMQPRSLYVHRKVLNANAINEWARSQGLSEIEDDLHVTVAYIKQPVDWMKLGQAYGEDEQGKMRIPPGGPRSVERFDDNAVVLEFASSTLAWRHWDAMRAISPQEGEIVESREYRPHITITYSAGAALDLTTLTPYRGEIVLGPEIFEEVKP